MIKYYLIIISIVLFCNSDFLWSQQEKPIQISALIGDTLDLVERDFYELFPSIEGFQYATYSLSSDSLIQVKVYYMYGNELRDTVNTIGLKSLTNIRARVNKIDEDFKPNEMGEKVSIEKLSSEMLEGELLYVSPNSITFIPKYEPDYELEDYTDLIEVYNFSEIKSITIINESDFSSSCLRIGGFTALGAIVAGALVQGASEGIDQLSAEIVGVIIVAAGIAVGILLEMNATNDEEIDLDKDFDYKRLKTYARYNRFEPEYLRYSTR